MSDTETPSIEEGGPVRFVQALVSLEYMQRPNPLGVQYAEALKQKRIIGHKCPECGKVYSPPRGFCPLCVVPTTDKDEVAVADKGTLTSFTVVTPVQYYGQKEREAYVQASILLDGSDTPIGQARIDTPHDQLRMGMRLQAVWKEAEEQTGDDSGGRGVGVAGAIDGWVPIDEPDVDLNKLSAVM